MAFLHLFSHSGKYSLQSWDKEGNLHRGKASHRNETRKIVSSRIYSHMSSCSYLHTLSPLSPFRKNRLSRAKRFRRVDKPHYGIRSDTSACINLLSFFHRYHHTNAVLYKCQISGSSLSHRNSNKKGVVLFSAPDNAGMSMGRLSTCPRS